MSSNDFIKNNYFLSAKCIGPTVKLTGEIVLVVLFVNDAVSKWTDKAKDEYLKIHNKTVHAVTEEAKNRNIPLRLRTGTGEVSVETVCSSFNYREWIPNIWKTKNANDTASFQKYFENKYNCCDAPILFVFNKFARSFAMTTDTYNRYPEECSVIFKDSPGKPFSERTVLHEILHQFGAVDLYFPDEVKKSAENNLPKSIMNDGNEIDSLTEYLIGWKDEISENANVFLKETSHITLDDIQKSFCSHFYKIK